MTDDAKLPREELLLKLLNMTTSDNDNIATISIRKANALLEAAGWTWEKLLKGKITVVEDPFKSAGRFDPFANDPRNKNSADAPQPYRPQRTPPRPAPPPPPPPKPTVNKVFPVVDSTKKNRYPGTCYCCAANVAVDAGFVFNPSTHNPSATDKWEVICAPCNSATALTIPNRKAKAPQWQNPNASQANPNLADL